MYILTNTVSSLALFLYTYAKSIYYVVAECYLRRELFISIGCGYVPTDPLPREDSDRRLLLYCLCKCFDSVAQPTEDELY
jgi:hypothetical protein